MKCPGFLINRTILAKLNSRVAIKIDSTVAQLVGLRESSNVHFGRVLVVFLDNTGCLAISIERNAQQASLFRASVLDSDNDAKDVEILVLKSNAVVTAASINPIQSSDQAF